MEAVWLSAFGLLVLLWVVTRGRQAPPKDASTSTRNATRNANAREGRSRSQTGAQSALPVLHNNGPDDDELEITVIKASPFAALASHADLGGGSTSDEEDLAHAEASKVNVIYGEEADVEEVTSPFARILISVEGESDRGKSRTRNEDSFLVMRERSLFVIADGMGGYDGGQIASALAVETLRSAFEHNVFEAKTESAAPVPRRGRELACAIQMANEAIWTTAKKTPQYAHMGTTVVSARFSPNKQRVYIGHVGDSRCYRLRGDALRQLTTDHTLGELGMRGPVSHHLFQAVGIRPSMTIDLIVDKPRPNDVYLLCSDGLSKMMKDEEIRDVLLSEPDLEAAVYTLIERANDQGGRDNVTVILLKVLERAQSAAGLMMQRTPDGAAARTADSASRGRAPSKPEGGAPAVGEREGNADVVTVDVEEAPSTTANAGSDSKTADAKTADAKTADAKTADAKTADAKTADARTADAKTADARTADARLRTPGLQTPGLQTPRLRTPRLRTPGLQTPGLQTAKPKRLVPTLCARHRPKRQSPCRRGPPRPPPTPMPGRASHRHPPSGAARAHLGQALSRCQLD